MPRYVSLIDWTQKGVESFHETVDRFEATQQTFEKMGVRFVDVYWTLGGHDIVGILDAPDDETATAALLAVSSLGNIRTKTLRAFSGEEMRAIIDKAI